MTNTEVERLLNATKGTRLDYPFGPEPMVFKVLNKMFAILGTREGEDYLSVKGKPEDLEVLTSQFVGISPGYHLNKRHWVTIKLRSNVQDALVEDLINYSYDLVVKNMTKAKRGELQAASDK
ncbi:hypothetical protein CS022_10625 [Veronia nyctiphanis]|uniref:MmcQ-like protein n=1 Tax=Veronia nyctiphanis TaxID=1278244 RepID=A0A4Q0YVK2_9GAMM|nr:MmcQ/YjbR family DNA-binding protein [Veronia nyctiphanis]RXJ73199.1 hypothetical protein CS022_10625 [Veronia nyctiphanis]